MAGFLPLLLLLSNVLLRPVVATSGGSYGLGGGPEEFTEELLLKPLPDRKVLSHFHFESRPLRRALMAATTASSKGHRTAGTCVFWLLIILLIPFCFNGPKQANKFRIQELELSFTQGRWNYERWGGLDYISSANAKPPGVELWAIFDIPTDQIDATWKNLTHALSGLFCSSINFLESTTAFCAPRWSFKGHSINLRYGALPREAVCTENLTPWLKLLPCRDKAGLASLLDRSSIYKGYYHSQRLHLLSTKSTGIVLEQTLTVVIQPNPKTTPVFASEKLLQPNWSVSSVFKRAITGKCALSKSSKVFFELEKGLVGEMDRLVSSGSYLGESFDLSVSPNTIRFCLFEYNIANHSETNPLDVGITWKLPLVWSNPQAPFHANRFLMGSGNERGSIAISLQSTQTIELSAYACMMQVVIFQMVPWYVRVYYHTLQILIDGKPQNVSDVVAKILVSPSEDKVAPGIMEIMLTIPCTTESAVLTMDFDKGFLHIDEYPPDANQGFDIPAAIISFPKLPAKDGILEGTWIDRLYYLNFRNLVQSYTEVLLVPLTTPDFSMPYNVITFTCTVLALYFGSLLNVLRRRVAEEERLLSKAATSQGLLRKLISKFCSKFLGRNPGSTQTQSSPPTAGSGVLFKVIAVALLAVIWHYFLSDSSN
ncbi:unnamed protein product [Spirodela intermedia]|uniref:Uncharacterized protein n=1 Tax=Spirodela intermedia TaxID=51605 RepID=A0A7I8IPM6_SPIIN|nr:unnamed protein product [Spirodela intermedia]CAA6659899.1 unnamed protein product [Spirodela intermedia]